MQRLIQKLPGLIVAILLVAGMVVPMTGTAPVSADSNSAVLSPPQECVPDKPVDPTDPCVQGDPAATKGNCAVADNSCELIRRFIVPAINLLVAAFGLILVISIVIGGIQLGMSAGDPQKAAAGKARIRNAVIALGVFVLLYGGLNFLIPGGLIGGVL